MSYALDVRAPTEIATPTDALPSGVGAHIASVEMVALVPDCAASGVFDEDAELLNRLAANDEAAFRTLVEKHLDRAYAIALRILRNAADAEDVVQDTMIKVWTQRGRWEHGRAKFSTWLYRVVSNRCIDMRRRPKAENMDVVPEIADVRPDASSLIERNEVTGILDEALQRLPEQQRIAVILSYHESMNNGEIAEVMGTTVSAVESLLKRGRQQLREMLRRHERDMRSAFTDR